MANGNGGAREGAGRPPGSKNIRQTELAIRLCMDGGETPFGILLKAARGYWLKAAPDGTNVEDYEAAKDAAEIAAKAAPFVHPRLNAITLDNGKDEPFVIRFDREDRDA